MDKKILITGATGFLGSHILEALVSRNYNVIILVRATSDYIRISHILKRVSLFVVQDKSDIERLFKENNIQIILHTANEYGRHCPFSAVLETNVLLPLRLIEEGLKRDLELFINTDTFFGKSQFKALYLKEYTNSKRILHTILTDLENRLKIANLRLEHVFGENDSEKKFVSSIVKQLLENKEHILLSSGNQKRDFIYVADVVDAYIAIIENEGSFKGFNEFEIGTGISISVKDFVSNISNILCSNSKLSFGAISVNDGEIEESKADIGNITKLGWTPKYDLSQAVRRIAAAEQERKVILKYH